MTVTVRGPRFVSKMDERLFEVWLQSIPCVRQVVGSGYDLIITLTSKRVPHRDLRELRAIFSRYHMDEKALAPLPGTREQWFRDPESYWKRMLSKDRRRK
jgi:hypothetical protein